MSSLTYTPLRLAKGPELPFPHSIKCADLLLVKLACCMHEVERVTNFPPIKRGCNNNLMDHGITLLLAIDLSAYNKLIMPCSLALMIFKLG